MTAKQGPEGTLSYTYYNHGELESVKSSITNGTNVSYTYDSLNRLTTVNDTHWTGNTSYTYDPFGNLASVNKPNGESVTYTYDVLNRLNSMAATVNGSSIRSYTYTLGPNGNRTNVAELSNRAVTYTYDDLYRLTGEIVSSDPATQNIGAISYQYDAVGNRTNRTSGITAISSQNSLSYDSDDRLTNSGYVYDNNGSTTTDPNGTYVYDSLGRMTQATVGSSLTAYTYDGDGNKVQQVVNNGSGAVTTSYLVDSTNPTGYAQVLEENQGSGVNLVYTYGTSRISEDQYNGASWMLSYYGYDGQGSVRYLTDSTGTITDTYDYDAFGTLINQTHLGTPTPNEFFYDAEQLDPNTGFVNLRARWMNPGIGRFQTMDSFEGDQEDPPSLHKYYFTSNNPINEVDPTGHDSKDYWPPDIVDAVYEKYRGGILTDEEVADIIYGEIRGLKSTPQADIISGYDAEAHVIFNQDWALLDKKITERPAEAPVIPPVFGDDDEKNIYTKMVVAVEFARSEEDPTLGALHFNNNRTKVDNSPHAIFGWLTFAQFGPFLLEHRNNKNVVTSTEFRYITCFQ